MAKEGNILSRIGDILSSNIHAALDKCEDPEKMLDQNMRKAMEDLADLKESAKDLRADQKGAQRGYDEAVRRMQAEHAFAVNAMKAGDEAAAAKFLQSEARIKAGEVEAAKKLLDAANANYEKIRQAHNKLADDIEFMKNRMNTIKGTMKVAKATETIASMTDKGGGCSDSFTKYADRAQRMLDEAEAAVELNTEPVDELASLRQQYAGGMEPDMSAALADLKAECGIGGNAGTGSGDSVAVAAVQAMDNAMQALRSEAGVV